MSHHTPKLPGMIHMEAVSQFMDDHIIRKLLRKKDKPPVKI
jgi:hypothetical protein